MYGPIEMLYRFYPERLVIWGIIYVAFALVSIFFLRKKVLNNKKCICCILFVQYIFALLFITLFSRLPYYKSHVIIWEPLWSYREILIGNRDILFEVIGNLLMFVPLGLLLKILYRSSMGTVKIMIIAVMLSFAIEFIQCSMFIGTAEVDDLIHNSLGALVGYKMAGWGELWLRRKVN